MAKPAEQRYAASPERVFQAAVQVVAELGYRVLSSDSASGLLSFNTGMSWRSWSGQNITATMLADGHQTRVLVTGGLAKKGTVVTGGQLVSWGEKGVVTQRFLDALGRALTSATSGAR